MIASRTITIDGNDFARGITSSAWADDGFFSPDASVGINIATVPGVLYGQAPSTDISPASSGALISSCSKTYGFGSQQQYFLTDTRKFYSLNTSYLATLDQTGAYSYSYPNSDMLMFKGSIYATSAADITLGTTNAAGSITALDETWWTVTKGKTGLASAAPHALLVYEDSLWIADAFGLHKWDGITASYQFLLLTQDQVIVALGIEPGSGRMMLSTVSGENGSGTDPKICKILLWDGFSNKVLRSIIVDEMVTAFHNVNGTVFVIYGRNLGYWNGSGITFLRRLDKISTLTGSYLGYKSHITSIGNCLYVVDGTYVLAYEVIKGGSPKVFYYAYSQQSGLNSQVGSLNLIRNMGSDNLGISYTYTSGSVTNYLFRFPTRTASLTAQTSFRTKYYKFPVLSRIREIRVYFVDAVAPNESPLNISVVSSDINTAVTFQVKYNTQSTSVYSMTYLPRSKNLAELEDFYLYVNTGDSNICRGIRKIVIYYDLVE